MQSFILPTAQIPLFINCGEGGRGGGKKEVDFGGKQAEEKTK